MLPAHRVNEGVAAYRQAMNASRMLRILVCQAVGVGRVLHVSSVRVYQPPGRDATALTENSPLGQSSWIWDYYSASKIATEQLCQRYPGAWTVVRPTSQKSPIGRTA